MTTLQEAARKALEALEFDGFMPEDATHRQHVKSAINALRTALAPQGEQQPVCAGCGMPEGDVHISTCQSGKWPLRVSNGDTAAPAPQAQPICKLFGTLPVYDSPAPQPAQEQVGINGLTEAETSATMSVRGLSEPAQGKAELIARSTKVAAELDDFNSSLDRKAAKCIRELLTAMQSAQPVSAQPMTQDEYERMTTNGAKAWAGVDPQELRTGLAPLTDDQVWFLWASENGIEDCDMCKLDDFKQVFRYVEKAHGITEKAREE